MVCNSRGWTNPPLSRCMGYAYCFARPTYHVLNKIRYYSASDPRLPTKYICIPCRLQGDEKFQMIRDIYPAILESYTDLVLFRFYVPLLWYFLSWHCSIYPISRSIKLAQVHHPDSRKAFQKLTKYRDSLAKEHWDFLKENSEWLFIIHGFPQHHVACRVHQAYEYEIKSEIRFQFRCTTIL